MLKKNQRNFDDPPKNLDFARRLSQVIDTDFAGNAADLARAMGCTSAAVSIWRSGRLPSRKLLQRLATVTGHSESWYLEGRQGFALREGHLGDPVGDHIGAAVAAGDGPGRVRNLVNFLRQELEPELRQIYKDTGVPFTDAYAGKLISDAVSDIGSGEPDAPVFNPQHWPHLLRLIVRAHATAVPWASSHDEAPEPVKVKKPRRPSRS